MQPGHPQQQYGYQPMQPPQQQQLMQQQHQQPGIDPKLAEALSTVDLLEGEQVYFTLQGDGYFMGASPAAKAMAGLAAFLVTVTGGHIRIYLVITNQRLLVLASRAAFCGWQRMKMVQSFAIASIKEVASEKQTQACCIHTRTVQVHTITERKNVVIKRLGDDDIRRFLRNVSSVLVAHSSRAGV